MKTFIITLYQFTVIVPKMFCLTESQAFSSNQFFVLFTSKHVQTIQTSKISIIFTMKSDISTEKYICLVFLAQCFILNNIF